MDLERPIKMSGKKDASAFPVSPHVHSFSYPYDLCS